MNGKQTKSVRSMLAELGVGEAATFPAERTSYLRACCTNFAFEWNKKFSTRTNREERTITVTRTA